MLTRAIKGVKDILPADMPKWAHVETTLKGLFRVYGYDEIRTPIIEHTVLFARSVGATSDIVEKEMYAFRDRGGDEITLRPEGTAGVVRAFIEHKMYAQNPVSKLFYIGPMFRRERPQAGRFRQFHQIGVEALGVTEPSADVEVLALLDDLFRVLGVEGVELQVNTLGCRDCRPKYREALIGFLDGKRSELCEDCQRRIDTNPLRALDCKAKGCKAATEGAPSMADHLDEECRAHFEAVKAGLDSLGIRYSVNPRMVRGLDYYTRTTFEMIATDKEGAQNAVAAGGRYDGLVQELGGPEIPGIGFALGIERLIGMLPDGEFGSARPDVFVAALGDDARKWALPAIHVLRKAGVSCEWDYAGASLKSQMKKADKANAGYVLIVGEDEMSAGKCVIRNMETKEQEEVALGDVAGWMAKAAGKE